MSDNEISKKVDHKRWLMNNNLFDDTIKNDFFFYGSIAHPAVRAVEFQIDAENKVVSYEIYLDEKDVKICQKFKELRQATGFFGLWRYKNMLKKFGILDPEQHVNVAIRDFCGAGWSATAKIMSLKDYDPSPFKEENGGDFGPGASAHKSVNEG